MPIETNRNTLISFYQRLDEGDESAIHELMDKNCLIHFPEGVDTRGPDEYYGYVSQFRAQIPNLVHILKEVTAEGDNVAVHISLAGSGDNSGGGSDSNEQTIYTSGIALYQFSDGKIAEAWVSRL